MITVITVVVVIKTHGCDVLQIQSGGSLEHEIGLPNSYPLVVALR